MVLVIREEFILTKFDIFMSYVGGGGKVYITKRNMVFTGRLKRGHYPVF